MKVHHAFRLTDAESGRILDKAIEIHTLELGWYNLVEAELATASIRDQWLYWFLHAHEYESEALLRLFPEAAMQQGVIQIRNHSKWRETATRKKTVTGPCEILFVPLEKLPCE